MAEKEDEAARAAPARVARGAGWLDSIPELAGWRDRIDLSKLDIDDPVFCVLGQAIGTGEWPPAPDWYNSAYGPWTAKSGFTRATTAKVIEWEGIRACGFMGDSQQEAEALKAAWTAYLTAPAS